MLEMRGPGLKQKTISGLFWSFIDNFAQYFLSFIIGIILARILSPKEFGLIGMITIFIAISESFIDSGFSQALIRKKECSDTDFSTVFFFNLTIGIVFCGLLILTAPIISRFFHEPQLTSLVRVLGIVLIIDALTMVQRTKLIKRIDFKLQTKISIIANLFSGIVGISMAFKGFGVWSLVARTLSQRGMNSFLLWLWNRWRPVFIFSVTSFKELFSFGSRLLISGLIDTIYRNIYYLVIGKYFSAQELGFYTRANHFKDLPSKNINGIISRVSYPVLAQLQDDQVKLKDGYKKLIKSTMFITFVSMTGMAAVAEPMVIAFIGEKWRPSIIYLQMLCFVGAFYPLHALNLNMLNVKGRSDLFLNLEIIKKVLAVPTIIIGVLWGIKIMILGMWLNSIIGYYLNSYYSGKLIKYPMKEQVIDILPGFLLALLMGVSVFLLGRSLPADYFVKFIVQVIVGIFLVLSFGEVFKFEPYLEIKGIITGKIFRRNNVRQ